MLITDTNDMTSPAIFRFLTLVALGVSATATATAMASGKQQATGAKPPRRWNADATKRLAVARTSEIPALLPKGANPNVRDARGCPVLVAVASQDCFRLWGDDEAFFASQKRDQADKIRAARALLAAGANPNLRDRTNWTALDHALNLWDSYDLELAKLLISFGGKSPKWGEKLPAAQDSLWSDPFPK